MIEERPPEYDAELQYGDGPDDILFFRRSLGLVRRLEQRFGPLPTLFRKLDAADVTVSTMAGLYEELMRGGEGLPRTAEMAVWIHERGHWEVAKILQKVVGELTVGAARLRALEDKRMADAEEAGENPTRPAAAMPPVTAASHGAGS